MTKKFVFQSRDTYLQGRITINGAFTHYFDENKRVFFYHFSGRGDFALPGDIFLTLYIKSGNQSVMREYECLGIYESSQRLRVVPFLVCSSPQGDESFVAFYEIISGRPYALSREEFGQSFTLDAIYSDHVPL